MTVGLLMGGANAASSLIQNQREAQAQASQAKAQKAAYDAQAKNLERQARAEEDRGRVEAEEIDRRKSQMRREFENLQGKNRSMLAAGNVDMTSGSAKDVSEGNINMFAQDLSDNAYQKALKEWETKNNTDALRTQAANAKSTGDWYGEQASKSSGGLLPSLLSAAISGAGGFASGYTMAGGQLGGLFGNGGSEALKSKIASQAGFIKNAAAMVRK